MTTSEIFAIIIVTIKHHTLLKVADDIAEACLLAPIGKVVPLTYNGDASSFEKHDREILLEILEEMYT